MSRSVAGDARPTDSAADLSGTGDGPGLIEPVATTKALNRVLVLLIAALVLALAIIAERGSKGFSRF